jgi:hypothetical protein
MHAYPQAQLYHMCDDNISLQTKKDAAASMQLWIVQAAVDHNSNLLQTAKQVFCGREIMKCMGGCARVLVGVSVSVVVRFPWQSLQSLCVLS